MSKVAVVYWSGTGNTEAMAEEVANGAKATGAEVESFTTDVFAADQMDDYDAVAFAASYTPLTLPTSEVVAIPGAHGSFTQTNHLNST